MSLGFPDPWREVLFSQVKCKLDKNKNDDSFNKYGASKNQKNENQKNETKKMGHPNMGAHPSTGAIRFKKVQPWANLSGVHCVYAQNSIHGVP